MAAATTVNPKDFVFSAAVENRPPDGGGGSFSFPLHQKTSFRDMVMGQQQAPPVRKKIDLFKESLAEIVYHNDNPLLPILKIDDKVFEGLCEPWKDALVVKLLGKNIGYRILKEKIERTWKLSAGFDIMDIDNDFFMVKFDSAADRAKVMYEGPWMIFDHYLTVQCWSPAFVSLTATIEHTMVWIRSPGLNLFYYDESILMALAAAVGTLIKVDANTLDVRQGKFARVCVEINLNKPVVGKVCLRDHWYKVEYEGLHRICSVCGCYGHLTRECKQKPDEEDKASGPVPEVAAIPVVSKTTAESEKATNKEVNLTLDSEGSGMDPNPQVQPHGGWLVVRRKSRNQSKQASNGKNSNGKADQGIKNGKKKSHATRTSHANFSRSISTQRAPLDNSQRQAPHAKAPNKRQRSHTDSPQPNHNPHNGPPKSSGHDPGPYDVGFGAQSAIHMKAVTPNRFILLDDDAQRGDVNMEDTNMGSQRMGTLGVVPETQPQVDDMAT